MSTVYVCQQTLKRDPMDRNKLLPKFDLEAASEYGEIKILIHPYTSAFNHDKIIPGLREELKNYCDDDYILPVGNPSMIGWVVALAAQYGGGVVKTLQYDGFSDSYNVVEATLF